MRKSRQRIVKETDLYPPVKEFLLQRGFEVRSEVQGCDVVAQREGELLIVELKRSVNLTLLLQGIDRQRMTDWVYLAVEAPRNPRQRRWREVIRLCQMLGLGLLTVTVRSTTSWVEIACEPEPYRPLPRPDRRRRLLHEFNRRTDDHNVGGSTQRPLVTAYREESLRIAAYLKEHGPSKVKTIRESLSIAKTGPILQRNYYRWYRRVSHGVYELTPVGERALEKYAAVIERR